MNKSIILNLVWMGVAVAAFVVGRTSLDPSGKAAENDRAGEKGSLSTRSGGSRSSGGEDSNSPGGIRNGVGVSGVTIAQYQSETDALVANKMFADLLLELRPENARAVFDALLEKRKNGGETGQQMSLFLEAWGKIDGEAALMAVGEMDGDGRRRGFASISAMKGWASTDPDAAKAHLNGLENGFEKSMLVQGMVSGMAVTDPNAATAYVLELEAERQAAGADGNRDDDRWRGYAVDRQMEAIANAQMQRGMGEATSWAESLPDGSLKSSAFDRVAESFARDNPEEAAEWVKAHADQEYASRAVQEISEELARQDPAAAVSWATDLPEATQAAAIRESMEQWTREDATAAGEYLTTMSDSTARDAAVSSFARTFDRENPALAAEWAGSISDENTRIETVESVARSWLRSNAEEAREWLPQSGLSAEAQQRVIEDASRGGRRGR